MQYLTLQYNHFTAGPKTVNAIHGTLETTATIQTGVTHATYIVHNT